MLFRIARTQFTHRKQRSTVAAEPASDVIERCRDLGRAGYSAGHKAPARDPQLLAIIREHGKVGSIGWCIPLLDAWNSAWHEEHVRTIALGGDRD